MPSSLALLPFPSGPDPITPTIHLPHDCTSSDKRQLPLPQQQQQQQQEVPQSLNQHWTAPWRAGLPTPPSDMMNGVAYNTFLPLPATNTAASVNPSSSSGSYYGSSYSGKRNGPSLHPYSRFPSQSRVNSSYDPVPFSSSSRTVPSSSKPQSYLPSSSSSSAKIAPPESVSQRKPSNQSVPSYLQIPSSISDSKDNIAEFAAQMTCLFWFESTAKLNAIEKRVDPSPTLVPEVSPASGFQKWVTTVLSTTQVSQNVILLALMFIYRLKKFNSGVKGKSGSEFRLLTIALMLGNKFLDDNTYTNKTWAEVSGIPVQEIHIMEVEFLSNVRYNLFASASEWSEWHGKLRRFFEFYRTASLVPEDGEQLAPITPTLRISPSSGPTPPLPSLSPASKLPSPPGSEVLRPLSNWNIPPVNDHSLSSYATSLPRMGNEIPPSINPRKRSREEPTEEHPTKRISMHNNTTLPPSSALPSMPTLPPVLTPTPTSVPSTHAPPMRPGSQQLPRPTIPSTSSGSNSNNLTPNIPTISHQSAPVSLRPMSSTTYNNPPAPPSNWVQQMPPVTSVPSVSNGIYTTPVSLPDPSRHAGAFSSTLSPALPAYSANTPIHLSPSFWLANRNSPYRPVRSVNTLLIPPPSASLQQHRSVPYDHMHYQPLGKSTSERRTGLVPYFQQESWPQGPISQPIFNPTPNYSS